MTIVVIGCLGNDLRLSLFDWRTGTGMGGLNDGGPDGGAFMKNVWQVTSQQ